MRKLFLTTATLCILIFSCISNKNRVIQTVPAFKKSPLDSIYTPIRPALQTFTIDNTKTTTIKAAHGSEILIPAGSFVTASGDKVANVQLEVVEAFSLPEFVTSGLATISNGQLLISNGMAYINAKAGNEDLQLKEGASLTVSMPTMKNADGFQLFTGDGSNWTADTAADEIQYAMFLPLQLIYPEGNDIFWYCYEDNVRYYTLDSNIMSVTNKKYENTIIATEAFRDRFYPLISMMFQMSYLEDTTYRPEWTCGQHKLNLDVFKVYFEHPHRSFRESDSIAKKIFIDYFNTNKEKLAAYFEESNRRERKRNDGDNAKDVYDFSKHTMEEFYMQPLSYFPSFHGRFIDDHGVNLDSANAYDQLVAKGISNSEINALMRYRFQRQNRINELKKRKEEMVQKKKVEQLYETTVFTIKQLGWINCDRFFDDPTAGKAEMYVSNTLQNKLDYVDYSLVIPDLNVRLAAFKDEKGRYTFTQNSGVYTKLPIGKNAVITAVSVQKDSLYYASQKIKIADGLAINLSMKPINTKNLKDSLQVALNN